MLDTVDAGANRIACIDNLEMAHHRNATRMRSLNRNLHEGQRQTVVDLDRRSTVVDEAINRKARFFRVANDKGVGRISGRRRIQMWTTPRFTAAGLSRRLLHRA